MPDPAALERSEGIEDTRMHIRTARGTGFVAAHIPHRQEDNNAPGRQVSGSDMPCRGCQPVNRSSRDLSDTGNEGEGKAEVEDGLLLEAVADRRDLLRGMAGPKVRTTEVAAA